MGVKRVVPFTSAQMLFFFFVTPLSTSTLPGWVVVFIWMARPIFLIPRYLSFPFAYSPSFKQNIHDIFNGIYVNDNLSLALLKNI
jgi:hypothetical protein